MKRLLVHINNIIEPFNDNKMSRIYDWVMLIAIVIGIFPLLFRMQIISLDLYFLNLNH